jgi:hypothetical protein
MHKKIQKCLGINPWVNKEQQRDPTQETIQLIQLKHWISLHH